MSKKRLLITASTFPRWANDTEPRFVLDLAIELANYYEVTVLAPAAIGAKDNEVFEGVKVIRYHYFPIHKWETLCYPGAIVPRVKEKKVRGLLIPFMLLGLYRAIRKIINNFDIVHSHWIIPQGIVQSYFKKPYVLTGHGGDVTSLNFWPFKPLKIKALLKASKVTVVSKELENEIANFSSRLNCEILPMGYDSSLFNEEKRIENYFGQNGKKVVLFVGRLAEKKGVTYLISAMRDVDAMLVIAGDGPLKSALMEQSKNMKNVIFIGAKTHQELAEIYASADIFVAPSITAKDGDKEGFGLVALEAIASGLPVIASDSGGLASIIEDNVNGILIPEKDIEALNRAIKSIINNDIERTRLRINALESIKQYRYVNIGKNYKKIIDEAYEKYETKN